jgi:AsmA protein
MTEPTQPTRKRRRWPWILAAAVVAIPVAGFVALRAFVNPESLRPRLVAAVEGATGRRFTVGDIRLALSLRPTVELIDIALANAEGGSRPEMVTARRVEVQAALLPLLSRRLEIARVVLVEPDILLETDSEGRPNWQFRRPAEAGAAPAPEAAPAAPEAAGGARQPIALAIDSLRLERGRVAYRDIRAGTAETVEIPALDAAAPGAGPTTVRGTLRLRGQDIAVEATAGALAAFGGEQPWPFDLRAAALGAQGRARGTLAAGFAWTAEGDATVPDLARLAPLLPDAPLPPLRDVALGAKLAGTGGTVSSAEALGLRVGRSDLSVLRPGLALERLEVAAPRLDSPLTLAAEGALANAPLRAAGTTGTPAQLLGRAAGPVPVDLRLEAAGATATARGQIAELQAMAGLDLALAAEVPDLAALAPLAGTPLPAIRDIRVSTRLAERTPGFQGGAHLRDLVLASPPAEARGELTLVVGERPGVTGNLDVARLDLDAIRAAMPAAPAGAAPAAPAPAPAGDGRVIPDIPLPVGALRSADADLRLTVASLTFGGQSWRDIRAPIGLEAGQGRVGPVTATTPAGPFTADVTADATADPPALRLQVNAPGLDLAALQRALNQPVRLAGRAEVNADLRGAGARLRGVAGSLAGHLGVAMVNGTAEPALIGPVEAALRRQVPIPVELPQRLPLECVAFRADAQNGIARIGTLLVDAPAAKVAGSGTVNLREETVAMRMLHDVRAAGTTVRVSADLGGPLASPGYRGARADNLGELLGTLGERLGGDAGAILGALGAAQRGGRGGARPEPLPDCAPSLSAARGERAPAAPARAAGAAPAEPRPAPQPRQPAAPGLPGPAGDILRGLLGR